MSEGSLPLRVLVAHNYYRSDSPSGELRVVEDDVAHLRGAGVDVAMFTRHSDEIAAMGRRQRAALAVSPVYARQAVLDLRRVLSERRPDVVHLHNPYPLLSPWVVREAARVGVPVVQTVHNFRHVCAPGTFFRDGGVCTDCVSKRVPWPAAVHGCYRGSRPQSAVMATALAVHQPTWRLVSRFLPVTPFLAEHLLRSGVDPLTVTVKPNSVRDPGPAGPPGTTLLYAGRLTPEKGIAHLLDAWSASTHPAFTRLVVAGDGPERGRVLSAVAAASDIDYLGSVPAERVAALMRTAGAVVVPSQWFEGFPITVLEAFAMGRAVVASGLGSLSAVVRDDVGWTASPAGPHLTRVLDAVSPAQLVERGMRARAHYLQHFTPAVVTRQLLQTYVDVTGAPEPVDEGGPGVPGTGRRD